MKGKINKRRPIMLTIIFALAALFLVFILAIEWRNTGLHAENGVLDLQSWEPEQNSSLSLTGGWDFYWSRYVTYRDIESGAPTPDITANVPGAWNSYKIDGENLPGFGYGTYALKVVNAHPGQPMALRIPAFSTAYELYVDGKLLASNGKIGTDREHYLPGSKPQMVEFTPAGQSFEIIVQVANFAYIQGGMLYAVSMGTPEQILAMDKGVSNRDTFLLSALAIMAFYNMAIFLMRREDRSGLYSVLMCVLMAGRTVISGDALIYRLIPSVSFAAVMAIDYITLSWFPVSVAFIVEELFMGKNSKKFRRVAFGYAAVITFTTLLTPVHIYSGMIVIIEAALLLISVYCHVILAKAFLRGKRDALFVLLAGLALIVCAIDDILVQNNASELGYVGILFMQSFVLALRFTESYKNVNTLSEKLLKLDAVKDEFLTNTSHELRTPLNGILGITEAMLKGSEGELSGGQRQNLSIIASSSRRLANLIGDILDYSKLKNGDILLNLRPIYIQGPINTVVNVFRQLNCSKEMEIISETSGELPPVLADENRLVQILYNLIGNAVKFTVRGCVKLSVRKTGDKLEICVSDTGEGIPEDKLDGIFKSFEQVDTSLTRRHGGTGLGLPITKHLVELQDGRIWVESTPGAGSRFYFTLPVSNTAPAEPEVLHGKAEPDTAVQELSAYLGEQPFRDETSEGSAKILVVDDDALSLQAAAGILRLGGYGVATVGGGKEALNELGRHSDYSLVILDAMMPEMSGFDVCRKLRERWPVFELPVLMLTARAATGDIVMGLEAGANDYLPKPFEPEELLARVRTLTGLKASVDKAMAAETAFMQAQIKPHFLYNTLNTISSFCDSDPDKAQELIDDFSNYLRQSFDFKSLETYVPLERELSLVSFYLEIEKARFGDQLIVEFDIDSEINVRIPLLTIQPLVENAVSHGIRNKDDAGTVKISAKKVLEGLMVSVADDGLGIPQDRLNNLLAPESSRGISLWNIDRRLKKLYGAGLIIESQPGKATTVSYIVPLEVV